MTEDEIICNIYTYLAGAFMDEKVVQVVLALSRSKDEASMKTYLEAL